jgi:hypothetical protein
MSHSTHVGFSGPPISALSGSELRSYCDGPPLLEASCTVGVGNRLANSPTGKTNILAREAAADDIDGNSIGSEPCAGKRSHVVVARDVRPVLCEDGSAERLDFAERDGSHSGSLKPEAEAADTAKEVEDAHVMPPPANRGPAAAWGPPRSRVASLRIELPANFATFPRRVCRRLVNLE